MFVVVILKKCSVFSLYCLLAFPQKEIAHLIISVCLKITTFSTLNTDDDVLKEREAPTVTHENHLLISKQWACGVSYLHQIDLCPLRNQTGTSKKKKKKQYKFRAHMPSWSFVRSERTNKCWIWTNYQEWVRERAGNLRVLFINADSRIKRFRAPVIQYEKVSEWKKSIFGIIISSPYL